MKHRIDVCLTPDLLSHYEVKGSLVVVTDVLRATSCMVTALAHGVKSIIPVSDLDECLYLKSQGMIAAGERNGEKVPEVDLGNSPFGFMDKNLNGQTLVMTTTNGTLAINKAKEGAHVVIGAFLNLSAMIDYVKKQKRNVIILCAGWKGRFNMEDTLFAGALIEGVKDKFQYDDDSAAAARMLYNAVKNDMVTFARNSSHARRLKKLMAEDDIGFCMSVDKYPMVPYLQNGQLVVDQPE